MVVSGDFLVQRKTFLITGGCRGIGLETAKRLARGGGEVILTTRQENLVAEGAERSEFLCQFTPNQARIHICHLDLANLKSVADFCKLVSRVFPKVDCIICNAGLMQKGGGKTVDGWEIHFGVNYLGHFYMLQLLLDKVFAGVEEPRIVFVSSKLLKRGEILFPNFNTAGSPTDDSVTQEYCDSKLCLALLARQMKHRCPNFKVLSVSPGWCRTDLGREDNFSMPFTTLVLMSLPWLMFSRSAESGSDSVVFCAASTSSHLTSGQFIRDRKQYTEIEKYLDQHERLGDLLWDFSMKALEEKLKNP